MTKSSFWRLTPREFDAEVLEQLTKEGRVYVDVPRVTDKKVCRREILSYVRAINNFATETWSEDVECLWKEIVMAECFQSCLAMKHGLQTGHMNRYVVTNLVCRLQNAGVYRQDISMLELHRRLEGISTRNRYYKSSGNYNLSKEARALLRKLISRV